MHKHQLCANKVIDSSAWPAIRCSSKQRGFELDHSLVGLISYVVILA